MARSPVDRPRQVQTVAHLLRQFPVVGILGARQVGKTTLAGLFAKQVKLAAAKDTGDDVSVFDGLRSDPIRRFDLEDPEDLARLDDARLALSRLRGIVILDEVQRRPDLFPVLRVLADRDPLPARFLVLGSASPSLLRQGSESLAGRIAYHYLPGIAVDEVGEEAIDRLWFRGGFPSSLFTETDQESTLWRRQFIGTFLQRDLPALGSRTPEPALRRFWGMLAHWHGQVWNASEFGRSFGVSDVTVRRYLDLLTEALVVRQLQPWRANLKKRQVKMPRVYIRDSGLLHALLALDRPDAVLGHPKCGASWEGFIVEQILTLLDLPEERAFFWRAHTGAELDLLVDRGDHRVGFEIKRTSSPRVTPSMRSALRDLELAELTVVHAGDRSFPMAENVRAVAAGQMLEELRGQSG